MGWLVFNQVPDGLTALGIGIICASGMAIAYAEHRRHRNAMAELEVESTVQR